ARERGFEPAFHPHTGSFVEAPWETERLLELTDVGIVLDTGHVTLGGGDALQALRDWRARIGHVHLKDLRLDMLHGVIADRADMPEAWHRGVFCELGTGDVDLDSFLVELQGGGYAGWLVIEQDWVPGPNEPDLIARVEGDQVAVRRPGGPFGVDLLGRQPSFPVRAQVEHPQARQPFGRCAAADGREDDARTVRGPARVDVPRPDRGQRP